METGSDFKVRDWLKAHQVPTANGKSVWPVSTIRKLLINRRYIAQIEINSANKGREDLPESLAYKVVPAPHEPLIPLELFERAQQVRAEKAAQQPNRKGRPRSYSQTQCQRVYPFQGLMVCAHCGHSMAPWYVRHRAGEDKSGKKRKKDSFIYYYLCAGQQKNWKGSDHKNCVSASKSEEWVWQRLNSIATSPACLEAALQAASQRALRDLGPTYEATLQTAEALRKVESEIEKVVATASNGQAIGALWDMLNDRAFRLKYEREQLLVEQRRLKEQLAPAEREIDAQALLSHLRSFETLRKVAEPEEMQQLARLMIRRIEWAPQSGGASANHKIQVFVLPQTKANKAEKDALAAKKQKPASLKSQQAVVSYCDALRWC